MSLDIMPDDILGLIWMQSTFEPLINRSIWRSMQRVPTYRMIAGLNTKPDLWPKLLTAITHTERQKWSSIDFTALIKQKNLKATQWVYEHFILYYCDSYQNKPSTTLNTDTIVCININITNNSYTESYILLKWLRAAIYTTSLPMINYVYQICSSIKKYFMSYNALVYIYKYPQYITRECGKWITMLPEFQQLFESDKKSLFNQICISKCITALEPLCDYFSNNDIRINDRRYVTTYYVGYSINDNYINENTRAAYNSIIKLLICEPEQHMLNTFIKIVKHSLVYDYITFRQLCLYCHTLKSIIRYWDYIEINKKKSYVIKDFEMILSENICDNVRKWLTNIYTCLVNGTLILDIYEK